MRKFTLLLLTIAICMTAAITMTACGGYTISFWDGDTLYYETTTKGGERIELPEPPEAREGWLFAGWYFSDDHTERFDEYSFAQTKLEADVKLVAWWAPYADVTVAGAEITGEHQFILRLGYVNDTYDLTHVVSVSQGASWSISADQDGSDPVDKKSIPLEVGRNVYYIQVLEADSETVTSWALIMHRRDRVTVHFAPDSEVYIQDQIVEEDGLAIEPDVTPQKTGYKFIGWDWDFSEDTVTSGCTIYARWEPITYTIHYDANGAEGEMEDQVLTYNASTYIRNCTYTFAGKKLLAWDSDIGMFSPQAAIQGLLDEDGAEITLRAIWVDESYEGTIILTYKQNIDNDDYTIDASLTRLVSGTSPDLTAPDLEHFTYVRTEEALDGIYIMYYDRVTYTVIFDKGSEGAYVSGDQVQTVRYGATVVPPVYRSATKRVGGWSESLSGIDRDVTISAIWIDPYKIIYKLYGATQNPDNPSNYIATDHNILLQAPTLDDAVFIGWYSVDYVSEKHKVTYIDTSKLMDIELHAMFIAEYVAVDDGGFKAPNNDMYAYHVSITDDKNGRLLNRHIIGRDLSDYDGHTGITPEKRSEFVYLTEEMPEWVYNTEYKHEAVKKSTDENNNVFNLGEFNSFSFGGRMINFIRLQHIIFDKAITVEFDYNTSFIYQTKGGFAVRAKCTVVDMDETYSAFADGATYNEVFGFVLNYMNVVMGLKFDVKPLETVTEISEGTEIWMDIALGIPLLENDDYVWKFLATGTSVEY